ESDIPRPKIEHRNEQKTSRVLGCPPDLLSCCLVLIDDKQLIPPDQDRSRHRRRLRESGKDEEHKRRNQQAVLSFIPRADVEVERRNEKHSKNRVGHAAYPGDG